jgi:hypothetical protein
VSVDAKGVITAVGPGVATVTVKLARRSASATFVVG